MVGRHQHTGRVGRPAAITVLMIGAAFSLAGCGSSADGRVTATSAAKLARWAPTAHIPRVLDISNPRRDATLIVATAGRLALLHPSGAVSPFARRAGGYSSPGGEEPYIALSTGAGSFGAGCSVGRNTLYALRLRRGPGVTAIDSAGHARRFATLPARGLETGIALDDTGHFGHRLLVTATSRSRTTVYAIDCHGTVTALTRHAPSVEGGFAVAPATFGTYAGDLIATDEHTGRIVAVAPDGGSRLVANSGLPHGQDVGVESAGFVPAAFGAGWSALLADRLTPGNPHPGDDVVLGIPATSLLGAGVRPGDLLVSTERGARTDAITCHRVCQVRHVADGPAIAHAEGHIAFRAGR